MKSVEYYLRNQFLSHPELTSSVNLFILVVLGGYQQFSSHAHVARGPPAGLDSAGSITENLVELAERYADVPMLSRTPGRPPHHGWQRTGERCSASTNVRFKRSATFTSGSSMEPSVNNALLAAYPNVDWESVSRGLLHPWASPGTLTQRRSSRMMPWLVFDAMVRVNLILIDMARTFGVYLPRLLPPKTGSR